MASNSGAGVGADGRLHVTHVVFDLHGGGMETLVAAMARRLKGSDIAMSVITLSGRAGRVGEAIRADLEQFHVPPQVPGLSMLAPLSLARAIRATGADVVHLHSGSWFKGARAARLAGVRRVIFTEHGREHADPFVQRWLDRRAARHTDVVVAVSDRLRRYLADRLGVDPARLCTIQNGVDTQRFAPGAAPARLRAELQIPAGALVIGSIGRLEFVKGYDRIIEAMPRLRARLGGRATFLVVFGDGSQRPALEALVQRLGLSDVVRLPGWTDTPEEAYRLLDVFAMTSRSEGSSVSLMEAMAAGAAPVVMAAGANAEILGPALEQQVVPQGDLDAFHRVAADTLASSERSMRIQRVARRRVETSYSLDTMLGGYLALYRGAHARTATPRC